MVNFGRVFTHFEFKPIGANVWTFLRDRGLPSNVQRALCTVKALSKTYRLSSARLRIAGAPISIHILGSWSPYTPNGSFRDHFCAIWALRPPCLGICKWMFLFTQSLRALRRAYTKESWHNGYVLGLLVFWPIFWPLVFWSFDILVFRYLCLLFFWSCDLLIWWPLF